MVVRAKVCPNAYKWMISTDMKDKVPCPIKKSSMCWKRTWRQKMMMQSHIYDTEVLRILLWLCLRVLLHARTRICHPRKIWTELQRLNWESSCGESCRMPGSVSLSRTQMYHPHRDSYSFASYHWLGNSLAKCWKTPLNSQLDGIQS